MALQGKLARMFSKKKLEEMGGDPGLYKEGAHATGGRVDVDVSGGAGPGPVGKDQQQKGGSEGDNSTGNEKHYEGRWGTWEGRCMLEYKGTVCSRKWGSDRGNESSKGGRRN